MKLIKFEPLDSLFFREAKPFNAGEGGFLDSQFPPPAQTLSGAIRTAIGVAADVDWEKKDEVQQLLGAPGDDPAPLSFAGPYLFRDGERLYPVPLNLLYSKKAKTWARLTPSCSPFVTDMGSQKLAKPEKPLEEAKAVEEGWLDASNMQKVFNGDVPTDFLVADDVFLREARAGIGRDNKKSVVNEGQLYFTRHIRLKEGITFGMGVSGAENLPDGCMVRLGGEGRLARIAVGNSPSILSTPAVVGQPKGLVLTLLTHADFNGKVEPAWRDIHPQFKLTTACIGKPVREGGWDYALRQPKVLKSLVPAGSCYFLEIDNDDLASVISKFKDNTHIGQRTAFGYGEIAVSLWQ